MTESSPDRLRSLLREYSVQYGHLPHCDIQTGRTGYHGEADTCTCGLADALEAAVPAGRMPMKNMTGEQLAVLADDIADMAQEFIDARDAKSLLNMATNLAGMIRLHVPEAAVRLPQPQEEKEDQTRVGPSAPRVVPTGSTAEKPTGEVTAAERAEQIAWLVALGSTPPQWWTGRGDEWTADVDGTRLHRARCAIRFARREDAERAIGWLLDKTLARGCKAEEHLWL